MNKTEIIMTLEFQSNQLYSLVSFNYSITARDQIKHSLRKRQPQHPTSIAVTND